MNRHRGRELAFAAGFFLLAAVLFTWPLAARMRSGMPDLWDDKLNAWIFHWDFRQLFRDPVHLFDTNIFYPAKNTLAFSENLFGAAVFGFPLLAAGASTLLTANVLMLLGMALSGLAAWALAREVTGDPAASLLAGVVYAFVPWRIAQLPHVQFQWGAFLALALIFLLRAFDSGRRRDAALFGLFFAWNAATNVHYAMFSGFLVALVLAHAALTLDRPTFFRRAVPVAIAGALACAAVAPLYIPYVRASRTYGMVRGEDEIESFSGRPIDFLTAGPQNKMYAPLTQKWGHGEGDFFPGLTAVALAAMALRRLTALRSRPDRAARVSARRQRGALALDVLVAVLLAGAAAAAALHRESFGPIRLRDPGRLVAIAGILLVLRLVLAFPGWSRYSDLADFARRARIGSRPLLFVGIAVVGILVALGTRTPFYRFLVQSFGTVFRAIRVPGRGIVLFDLALAVLAAWGLALATREGAPRLRGAAVAGALLLLTIEYRAFPIDIADVPEQAAPVYRWLASLSVPGSVAEIPIGFEYDPEHVFRSTAHWKPLVNGYSGFAPRPYDELRAAMEQSPIPDSVWDALRRLDASILLVHPSEMNDQIVRRYSDLLRRGLRAGRLEPLGSFARRKEEMPDLAFRLAGAPAFAASVPPGDAIASREAAIALVDRMESRTTAPFGVVDHPLENETIAQGYWAFGWALDDSGIERVTISAEGTRPAECALHSPYPGVAAVYGRYPEAQSPGFGCPVPRLPPGPRVLVFELVARDGGTTALRRRVRIASAGR